MSLLHYLLFFIIIFLSAFFLIRALFHRSEVGELRAPYIESASQNWVSVSSRALTQLESYLNYRRRDNFILSIDVEITLF